MVQPEEEVLVNPLDNLLDEPETTKETTPEPAKETDNSGDQDKDQEEEPEVTPDPELTPTEKRHAEQQEGARLEVERAKAETAKVRALVIEEAFEKASVDARVLLELHKKDPIAAEAVAVKFGYDNFKDAKNQINAELGIAKAEPMSDEEKEEYYQERRAKEEHTEAIAEAKAMFDDMPEETKQQALTEFEDLIEGKTLTKAKAIKFADMISLSLGKGKAKTEAFKDGVKKLTSVGITKVTKADTTDQEHIVVDGKLVLLTSKNTK